MGHEAFGSWLIAEIGPDVAKVKHIIARTKEMYGQRDVEELIHGGDFSLTLTEDDAIIKANSLHIENELPEGEDFSLYDDELFSQCGLDDFESMLHSWLEFITPRRLG